MNLSRERLLAEATALSFRPEILEKVARLLSLLEALRRHPRLKGRLALKGGTALNLFCFDVPRLSVDIDLNYMFRVPLWPVQALDSRPLGRFTASGIPVLDIHEIAAGKLAALLSRRTSRDLFDAHALLARHDLDDRRLRTAFVAYGAMNRVDWRTVSPDSIGFELDELREELLPVLRSAAFRGDRELKAWADSLVDDCRKGLSRLFPFTKAEREFLDRVLDHGEIRAELLTDDDALRSRIDQHPSLAWKAQNVKKHFGR